MAIQLKKKLASGVGICATALLAAGSLSAVADQHSDKKKSSDKSESITVPVTVDFGVGIGELETSTPLTVGGQKIYALKLNINGVIDDETMDDLDYHIPHDLPDWVDDTEFSHNDGWFPDSIYFTDSAEGDSKIYGFRYGPSVGGAFGPEFATIKVNLGVGITYLYMDTPLFDENHYLTFGANAGYALVLKPFKFAHLEFGRNHSWNFGDELSNGKTLSDMQETYGMLRIRFPVDFNSQG